MKKNKVMTWVNPKSKWADSFQKMFDEMFDERFNEVMKLTDKKVRKELELALKHRSLPQTHKHLKRKRGI